MIEKPTTAELEKSPSGRAFLYALGGLILKRRKEGKTDIGDLDHGLLWYFFDTGWRWGRDNEGGGIA